MRSQTMRKDNCTKGSNQSVYVFQSTMKGNICLELGSKWDVRIAELILDNHKKHTLKIWMALSRSLFNSRMVSFTCSAWKIRRVRPNVCSSFTCAVIQMIVLAINIITEGQTSTDIWNILLQVGNVFKEVVCGSTRH